MTTGAPIDVSVGTWTSLVGVKFKPTARDSNVRVSLGILLEVCERASSELREDAAFCWKCGASVRGTMGVQSPTGFELLRDDKNVQNHWARRLIAYIIDAALVTVVLTIIAVVTSITFLIGMGFPAVGTFPAVWAAWWGGLWFAGLASPISLVVFLYFFLAEGLYGRTLGKEIMGLQVQRVDGKPMDMRSSLIRNISKISWVLLLIVVAVGLGTHGEMSQKWSDRYVRTKVEEKTRMTIIP